MGDIEDSAAIGKWLDELEGYSLRGERLYADVESGLVSRVMPWLKAAYQLGREKAPTHAAQPEDPHMIAPLSEGAPWDGFPENPERDGWHWLRRNGETKATRWELWGAGYGSWRNPGDFGGMFTPQWLDGEYFEYLGPCLPPEEIRALTTDRDALQQRVRELDHEVFRRGEAALKLAEGWSKEAEEGNRLRLLLGMNPQPQGSPR